MAKMKAQKAKQTRRGGATELDELSHLPDDVRSELIKKRRPVVRNWIDRTDHKAPSIVRLGHPLANAISYMIDIYESYGCSDEETLLAEAAILLNFASHQSQNDKRKKCRTYKISCEIEDNPFYEKPSRRARKV